MEASALTLARRVSGILLFLTWDLCLPDPRSPFRAGSGNLSVGSLSTGHLNCWSQRGTKPVTSPAEPCTARCPGAASCQTDPTSTPQKTGADWRRGSRFPVKRSLLDSAQTAVLWLGFRARRGAARMGYFPASPPSLTRGVLIPLDYGFRVAERLRLTYAPVGKEPLGSLGRGSS